jgi:hypothetical protein
VLEAIRRLWWRAFDRVCYWIVLMKLSIHHRIYGPEPPRHAPTKYVRAIMNGWSGRFQWSMK